MNAGLPGTGIGGLFYIAGALWMPIDATYQRLSGRRTDLPWKVVARQAGIAVGVLAALWLTGWGVGFLVAFVTADPAAAGGGPGAGTAPSRVTSIVRWATLIGSTGVLVSLVGVVQLLRLTVSRPAPRRALAAAPRVDIVPVTLASPAGRVPVREVA